jgi:hypothetical protein
LGNSEECVSVYGDSNSTTVGGGAFGAVKVTAFTKVLGMEIIRDDTDAPTSNCFLNNSIFSKAGLVIDLGDNGVMPNEPRNRDTGFINQQNFPILSSAATSEGSTTVKGSLNRAPPVRAFSSSFLHSFWPTGQDPHWPEGGVRIDARGNASSRAGKRSNRDPTAPGR